MTGRTYGTHGGSIGAYRVWVEIPMGKRPYGRPKRGWQDNIKWIFKKLN